MEKSLVGVVRGLPRQFSQYNRTFTPRFNITAKRYIETVSDSSRRDLSDSFLRTSLPPIEAANTSEAKFEVVGAPYSLLSVSLSASADLYTRRGTLVGVTGKPENAVSTLRVLEPFRRAALGIPFLYQRVSSSTPLKLLISAKSSITSFAVVQLDGTVDWMIAQRQGILAWVGHDMWIRPTTRMKLSLAHWGNSRVTGRGLLALVGNGHLHQINLKKGEQFVVHPSNVLAYTLTESPPLPYRLKSSALRFQVPSLDSLFPDTKFFQTIRRSEAWRVIVKTLFNIRTWSRRAIWGDRLFLRFEGPSTLLLQSRGSRLTDSLTARDINEIADSPAGVAQAAAAAVDDRKEHGHGSSMMQDAKQSKKPNHIDAPSNKVEFKKPTIQ